MRAFVQSARVARRAASVASALSLRRHNAGLRLRSTLGTSHPCVCLAADGWLGPPASLGGFRGFAKKKGKNKNKNKNKNKGGAAARGPEARGAGDEGAKASAVEVNQRGYGIIGDVLFSVRDLNKVLPGNRPLLSNVNINFLRGAKIGVLGLNGSGKSTLLKVIAGIERDVDGEVWTAEGCKVGYLPQEPELDPEKVIW